MHTRRNTIQHKHITSTLLPVILAPGLLEDSPAKNDGSARILEDEAIKMSDYGYKVITALHPRKNHPVSPPKDFNL